jgi:hypothetical protein
MQRGRYTSYFAIIVRVVITIEVRQVQLTGMENVVKTGSHKAHQIAMSESAIKEAVVLYPNLVTSTIVGY